MNYLISKRICSTKVYLDPYVSKNYETRDIDLIATYRLFLFLPQLEKNTVE